jgi:hypothetical protein
MLCYATTLWPKKKPNTKRKQVRVKKSRKVMEEKNEEWKLRKRKVNRAKRYSPDFWKTFVSLLTRASTLGVRLSFAHVVAILPQTPNPQRRAVPTIAERDVCYTRGQPHRAAATLGKRSCSDALALGRNAVRDPQAKAKIGKVGRMVEILHGCLPYYLTS